MGTDGLVVYADWDVTRPALPPRSRLFHLAPVGVGTPEVESLTGYVARLAEAHGVPTKQLAMHELFPGLGRPHLAEARHASLLSAFWRNETRALNGTRALARQLIRTLETLTGRRELRCLTLVPWADVLAVQQLQRRARAWCPGCYEEWRQAGAVIYEPLRWSLVAVTACPRHGRCLQLVCPHPACRRASPPLAARSRPGYCPWCERWLGAPPDPPPTEEDALTAAECAAQHWVGQAVGELLAAAPGPPGPARWTDFADGLAASVRAVAGGNRSAWARALGLPMETVANWQWGRTRPSLPLLLLVCRRLGTTPLRFLQGDSGGADRPAGEDLARPGVPLRPPGAQRRRDREALRAGLDVALASEEQPPPSLHAVARLLGVPYTYLHQHFPEQCRAISTRFLQHQRAQGAQTRQRLGDEVRQAVRRVHAQGLYPSANRVASFLSQPGHLRNPAGRAALHEALRELGWRT